jgi:hypothetical protein
MKGDISPLKEVACNFAYFLHTFSCANVTFDVSPYHSQTVCADQLLPIYEKMVEILKGKVHHKED